jgi:uncharacterized membrane protein YhaH (DUF805 family)
MNGWQYFIGAIKKYAVFKGRARRAEYWWFALFYSIFVYGLFFTAASMARSMPMPIVSNIILLLSCICSLALCLPCIGVSIHRMHDVNKSGWFVLVPIYNLVLACTKGTPGPNRFGNDPKIFAPSP